ncbi:MAG TPA: hypothetical protein ENK57_25350 [Polyangiaceae bacterium]|nr:hypothetical protein [Polyangiaceae bacterium]
MIKLDDALALAAATGLLAGVTACDDNKDAPGAEATPKDTAAATSDGADCCAGKNDCKGKGGCKTADHDCSGKNDCKGKGGCKHRECT